MCCIIQEQFLSGDTCRYYSLGRLAGLVAFGTFGLVIQRALKLFRKKDIFGLCKSGLGVILNFSVNSFPYYSLGQLAGLVAFGTFGWLI